MTDQDKIEAYLREKAPTPCPSAPAWGTQWYRPTAAGYDTPQFLMESPKQFSPEAHSAIAKLIVMFQDLGGKAVQSNGSRHDKDNLRNAAHHWFFGRSDFEICCDAAGWNPSYVRAKAKQVWENGLPQLRALPGQGPKYDSRKRYRAKRKLLGLPH